MLGTRCSEYRSASMSGADLFLAWVSTIIAEARILRTFSTMGIPLDQGRQIRLTRTFVRDRIIPMWPYEIQATDR